MRRYFSGFILTAMMSFLIFSCGSSSAMNDTQTTKSAVHVLVPLYLKNVGLLDALAPVFSATNGQTLIFQEATNKQMIEQAKAGLADVLIDNSKLPEKQLSELDLISKKNTFMSDEFVLVGPKNDPAGVRGLPADAAFRKIAQQSALFYSFKKSYSSNAENALWKSAGINAESQPWYEPLDGTVDETLIQASQQGAYMLVDRYTFLRNQVNLSLEVMVEADPALKNQYYVLLLTPTGVSKGNTTAAKDFYDFLSSDPAKLIIKNFGVNLLGQQIFTPHTNQTN